MTRDDEKTNSAIAKYLSDLSRNQEQASSAVSSVQKLLDDSKDVIPTDGTNISRKNDVVKEHKLVEYDSQSSAEMQREMMRYLNKTIFAESKSKNRMKHHLLQYFMWFFSIVTGLLFFVVIDPFTCGYSDTLKLALVGGFFTNLIALFTQFIHKRTRMHGLFPQSQAF